MSKFTHIDDKGRVRMVDVTGKKPTVRVAVAGAAVSMKPEPFNLLRNQKVKRLQKLLKYKRFQRKN